MRILHTSDWHLGATLEGVSREPDHAAFLGWLASTLEREEIDVLVVAGDIFDQAHPSSEAQRLYFSFLRTIAGKRLRKVVVVGGNHDSASRLDAPAEVLQELAVHVVGGLPSDEGGWDRCLCPVPGENGGTDLVVVAVPFMHEYRLGVRTTLASSGEIAAAFTERFTHFYRELAQRAETRFEGAPLVATGHLTCTGYETGDWPADIHMVGSIGGLPPSIFDERFRYVALGHIHRSYQVGDSRAYYSGSPITLSLNEARLPRSVRIVELGSAGEVSVRKVEIPSPRAVLELRGSVAEVAARLRSLTWNTALPPIVYATVEVEHYRATAEEELKKAVAARAGVAPLLVQVRQQRPVDRAEAAEEGSPPRAIGLRDLTPEEVFLRLCADRQEPTDEKLLNAFRSLLSTEADERGAA